MAKQEKRTFVVLTEEQVPVAVVRATSNVAAMYLFNEALIASGYESSNGYRAVPAGFTDKRKVVLFPTAL